MRWCLLVDAVIVGVSRDLVSMSDRVPPGIMLKKWNCDVLMNGRGNEWMNE